MPNSVTEIWRCNNMAFTYTSDNCKVGGAVRHSESFDYCVPLVSLHKPSQLLLCRMLIRLFCNV